MKIKLSNNSTFEIHDEILTIEEFLTLADKLRELTLLSRGFEEQKSFQIIPSPSPEQEFQVPETEEKKETEQEDLPLDERIYKLKKEGNEFSQIAKAYNIPTSEARRLFQRVYQRNWMRKNAKKTKGKEKETTGKKRKRRAPFGMKWTSRDEVLNAVKVHYFGTAKDKENIARARGKPWNDIVKSFWNLCKRYNIKPADLGLKKWGKVRGKKNEIPKFSAPEAVVQKDEVLSIAEKQFVEFFNNYFNKGGSETELRQAVLLLREWLKSQGKAGSVQEVLDFLGARVKSLRPLIQPAKLEEWFR